MTGGSSRVVRSSTLLRVAERVEAGAAVVRAHAARADAAERQVGHREVEQRARSRTTPPELVRVDARGRRRRRPRENTYSASGLSRALTNVDRGVDVVDREHRQHRPEDLLAA